jgi:hypothetical protein
LGPKQLQQQGLEQLLRHKLALVSLEVLQLDHQVCLVVLMPRKQVCFTEPVFLFCVLCLGNACIVKKLVKKRPITSQYSQSSLKLCGRSYGTFQI